VYKILPGRQNSEAKSGACFEEQSRGFNVQQLLWKSCRIGATIQ
jgi:hypothetical protein